MPQSRVDDFSRDAVVALCCASGSDEAIIRLPMTRWQAEAVADALSRSFPERKYWIEDLSSIPPQGHVHRFRTLPHKGH